MSADRRRLPLLQRLPGVETVGLRDMTERWGRGWQGTRICCVLLTQCQDFLPENPIVVKFGLRVSARALKVVARCTV